MAIDRDQLLNDLPKLQVILNFDGAPDYGKLQERLIVCDNFQRKIVNYLNQIEPELSAAQNSFRNEQFSVSSKKRDIKTNNSYVKSLPTGKERDEAAESILEDDYRQLLVLENEINTLTTIKGSLTTTLKKLKGTEQNIKLLKTIADQQVSKLNVGTVLDPQVAEMNRNLAALSELDRQMHLVEEIGFADDVEGSTETVESEEIELPEEESCGIDFDETSTTEETPTPSEEDSSITIEDASTTEETPTPAEENASIPEPISIHDIPDDNPDDLSFLSEYSPPGEDDLTDDTSVINKPSSSESDPLGDLEPEETLEGFLEKNPVTLQVTPSSKKSETAKKAPPTSEPVEDEPQDEPEGEKDISISGDIDFDMDFGGDPEPSKKEVSKKEPSKAKETPKAKEAPQKAAPSAKVVAEDDASIGMDVDVLDLLDGFN